LEDPVLPPSVSVIRIAALALAAGLIGGPALLADEPKGRFTMMPLDEDRIVRLDTQTGVTSICKPAEDGLKCVTAEDDQQKLRDEMARLEAENRHLKNEMRLMEETLGLSPPGPGGASPQPDGGPPAPKARIPSEQDVDRMFDYLESMVRKFKERIERLDRPPMSPDSAEPGGEVPAEPETGEKGEATPL
jgi:hypothetical protein